MQSKTFIKTTFCLYKENVAQKKKKFSLRSIALHFIYLSYINNGNKLLIYNKWQACSTVIAYLNLGKYFQIKKMYRFSRSISQNVVTRKLKTKMQNL